MPTWRAAQRAGSASMSWSGASAVLVPVRHSRIRFPSILNSAAREVVGRQARTRVRNGLSGASGRITTLRVEASSESTAIWGISVMPSPAATIWIRVRRLVAWKTSLRTGSTIRHACSEWLRRQCPSSIRSSCSRDRSSRLILCDGEEDGCAASLRRLDLPLFPSPRHRQVRKEWPPAKCRALRSPACPAGQQSEPPAHTA